MKSNKLRLNLKFLKKLNTTCTYLKKCSMFEWHSTFLTIWIIRFTIVRLNYELSICNEVMTFLHENAYPVGQSEHANLHISDLGVQRKMFFWILSFVQYFRWIMYILEKALFLYRDFQWKQLYNSILVFNLFICDGFLFFIQSLSLLWKCVGHS